MSFGFCQDLVEVYIYIGVNVAINVDAFVLG